MSPNTTVWHSRIPPQRIAPQSCPKWDPMVRYPPCPALYCFALSSPHVCVQFTVVLHKPFGIAFRTDDLHRCVVSKTRDCAAALKEGDRLVAVNNNPVCEFRYCDFWYEAQTQKNAKMWLLLRMCSLNAVCWCYRSTVLTSRTCHLTW